MLELKGDLFDPNTYKIQPPHCRGWVRTNFIPNAICITTNGFVKKSGECVMGRGCAKKAALMFPKLAKTLGLTIKQAGNIVHHTGRGIPYQGNLIALISFPVKPVAIECNKTKSNIVKHMRDKFRPGDTAPGWAAVADPDIIRSSAHQLVQMANGFGWGIVVLPRCGCGAGELVWSGYIEPILQQT